MCTAWPLLALTLAGLIIGPFAGTAGAKESSACGRPDSPPSCLAPCRDNPAMKAARAAIGVTAESRDANALYRMARTWIGIPDHACRPDAADYLEAAEWLRRAAALGLARAQFDLGRLYERGRGVSQDRLKAFRLYQEAAAQGHVRATFRIGVFHDFGWGPNPREPRIAALWYARAARMGSCDARFALATMYYRGRGIPADSQVAYGLYDLVAEGSYPEPCYGQESGDARRYREAIATRLTGRQITAARAEARRTWEGH